MSLCSTLGFATPWRCILRHTAIVACFVRRCVGSVSGWLASNSRVLCFTYIVSNCSSFFQDFSMEAVAAIGLATNVLHMAEAAKDITSIVKDIRILASGFTKETIRSQKQAEFIRGTIESLTRTATAHPEHNVTLQPYLLSLRNQLNEFYAQLISLCAKKIPKATSKHSKALSEYGWRRVDFQIMQR